MTAASVLGPDFILAGSQRARRRPEWQCESNVFARGAYVAYEVGVMGMAQSFWPEPLMCTAKLCKGAPRCTSIGQVEYEVRQRAFWKPAHLRSDDKHISYGVMKRYRRPHTTRDRSVSVCIS